MAGATAGTLTFMVGGDAAVFEEGTRVLSAMGKNMVHVGAPGTGGVTKLCNNLGLAIHMVGTAEAMNLVSIISVCCGPPRLDSLKYLTCICFLV